MSMDRPGSPSVSRHDIFSDAGHEDGWGDVALASTPSSRARDNASRVSYITHDLRAYRAEKVGPLGKQGLREGSSSSCSSSRRNEKQQSSPMGDGRFQCAEEVMSLTTRTPLTPALRLRVTSSHQSNSPDHGAQEDIAVRSHYSGSTTVRGIGTEASVIISDKRGGRESSSRRSSFSGLDTTGESFYQRSGITGREILGLSSAQASVWDDATLDKALGDTSSKEGRVGRQSWGFPVPDVETREIVGSGGFAGSNIDWAEGSRSQSAFGETGALHEFPARRSHTGYVSERVGSAQFPLSWSGMDVRNGDSRVSHLIEGRGTHALAQPPSPEFGVREHEGNPRNSNLSNEHGLRRPSTESILSDTIIFERVGGRSSTHRESGREQQPSAPPTLSKSGTLTETEDGFEGTKNAGGGNGGSYADVGIEGRPSRQTPFIEMNAAEGGSAICNHIGSERLLSVRQSFSNMDMLERAVGRSIEAGNETDSRQSPLQSKFLEVDILGETQSVGDKNGYVGNDGRRRSLVQFPIVEVDALEDHRSTAVADAGRRPSAQSFCPQVDKAGPAENAGNSSSARRDMQFTEPSLPMDGDQLLNDVSERNSFARSGRVSEQAPSWGIETQALDSDECDGKIDHSIGKQLLSAFSNVGLLGEVGVPAFDISGTEMQSPKQSQPSKANLEAPEDGRRNCPGNIDMQPPKLSFLANTAPFGNDDRGERNVFDSGRTEGRPSVNSPLLDRGTHAVVGVGRDRESFSSFSEIDLTGRKSGRQICDTCRQEAGERDTTGTERQSLLTLLTQSHLSNIGAAEADDGIRSCFPASAMLSSAGKRVGSRNSYTSSDFEEQSSLLSPFEIDKSGVQVGASDINSSSSDRQTFCEFLETATLGEELGGRTSFTSTERLSSKHGALLGVDALGKSGNGRLSALAKLHPPFSERDVPGVNITRQTGLNCSEDERQLSSFFGRNEGESHIDNSSGSQRFSISHLGAQHSEEANDQSSLISTSKHVNERWSRADVPSSFTDEIGGDAFARDIFAGNEREQRASSLIHRSLDTDRHGEGSDEKDNDSDIDCERWALPSGSEPLVNDTVKSRRGREIGRTYVNFGGSRQASRLFQVASEIDTHGDEGGKNRGAGSGKEQRPSIKEQVADGVLESQRELRQAWVIPGRRDSRLASLSEIDRDSESPSEVRGRGSLNNSSRRTSRVLISPSSEAAGSDDFNSRDRDEYGEVRINGAEEDEPSLQRRNSFAAQVGERVPPEWALLLLGCLLGLATGLSVVLFNKGVHFVHDMAWAGTPREGAAWLRLQQLIDIWHRVMLIPVVGGVVVGMMHVVVGILDQVKGSRPHLRTSVINLLAGAKPTVKAGQAMVTLGTGCSLGPEGPSVDIGKAWAHGLATVMKNNRERRIALVAAGAAAGISAGFNAPVSGMFFAIETVLRRQHAENSPLTTAMIILASVISSATSQVLLEETAAFTVPTYELRSAAELPLYLILGGVCGVVSVAFTWMTTYFMEVFECLRDRCGMPQTVTPAIGGLVTGLVSLKYPGVLYWGFYNVDEILHSGKTATAPGAWLVTQLICAKVFATAFCKGSGLVGGVYAPSLFVGAAVGSVYGTMAGKIVNAAIPGQDTVAHPQAYALVGMAALLAAVCSVPLTSVLLLFELTKDYHILLPLMGGIGVAIWVASVAKPSTEKYFSSSATAVGRAFHPLRTTEEAASDVPNRELRVWRRTGSGTEVELCTLDDHEGREVVSNDELMENVKVSQAMSKTFVKVERIATVKETIGSMLLKQQTCALVVDENGLIEGIFTFADLESEVIRAAEAFANGDRTVVEVDKMLVAAFCSGNGDNKGTGTDLLVCFPDMSLKAALEIMQSSGYKQLPVVARAGKRWQDEGRHIVGLLYGDAIPCTIREEASKRISAMLAKSDEDDDAPLLDAH